MSDLSRMIKKTTSVSVDSFESAGLGMLWGFGVLFLLTLFGMTGGPAFVIASVIGSLYAVASHKRRRDNLHKTKVFE